MRGRTMHVPDIEGLRPTPSRVREALFNMLGNMDGLSVLDLFAGSGVMSLEAISRGATSVTSIESNRKACQAMRKIEQDWQVPHWHIQQGTLPNALPTEQYFDVVFADPPYAKGVAEQVPSWLRKNNITYNQLVIEESSRAKLNWQEGDIPFKQRKYSETTLYFFEMEQS